MWRSLCLKRSKHICIEPVVDTVDDRYDHFMLAARITIKEACFFQTTGRGKLADAYALVPAAPQHIESVVEEGLVTDWFTRQMSALFTEYKFTVGETQRPAPDSTKVRKLLYPDRSVDIKSPCHSIRRMTGGAHT